MGERVRGDVGREIDGAWAWWVAIASTLILTVSFGSTYLISVALKPIAADFDWPRSIPSLGYALIYAGTGAGGMLAGWWSDRHGMFQPALVATAAIAGGSLLSATSTGMTGFLIGQGLLVGLMGSGFLFSPMMSNATRWFERRRGLAVALVASGQSLAGALWPPVARWGIEEYGWRQTMIGYGVVAIVVILPLSFTFRRRTPRAEATAARDPGRMTADGRVLGLPANLVLTMLGLAFVGCCVAMAMPLVHIVAYCTDLGFQAARGAEMLSLLLACAFLSRMGFGWLADRIGGLQTILLSSSLQTAALSLYTVVDGLLGLYMISALFGLVFGGIVPAYALAVRQLFPEGQAGWRIGVVYFFGTSAMGLGGLLGGFLFDLSGGYHLAFVVGVAFNVANLAIVGAFVWLLGGPATRAPVIAAPLGGTPSGT